MKMKYKELLEQLSQYNRVIVGGIQRSGTTYGAYTIAQDLGYEHVDENRYYVHNTKGFLNFLKQDKVVIQNVCHTQMFDQLHYKDTILVWMDRDNEDIARSEDKINWHPKEFNTERNKYRQRWGNEVNKFERNALMKKHYWELQKPEMKIPYLEVPYTILEETSGYVSKDVRKSFKSKQIQTDLIMP